MSVERIYYQQIKELEKEIKSMKNRMDYDETLRVKMVKENKQLKQKLEQIVEYAEQLRYTKPTISWQLREFLGLNKNE